MCLKILVEVGRKVHRKNSYTAVKLDRVHNVGPLDLNVSKPTNYISPSHPKRKKKKK